MLPFIKEIQEMNDPLDMKEAEKAWKEFMDYHFESTLSSKQDCVELFTLQHRAAATAELMETIENFDSWSFESTHVLLVVLGFGAFREGAKAYASLAYPRGAPLTTVPVSFEELTRATNESAVPGSAAYNSLREAMIEHSLLDTLVTAGARAMLTNLFNKFDQLKPHEEQLERMLLTNMVHGIRVEFLLNQLIEKSATSRRLVSKLIHQLEDHKELFDAEAIEYLKSTYTIKDSGSPWPQDLQCRCGADLHPSIICCDQPIDPATFKDELTADFLLKTTCCGATLTGFRCLECNTFHSWAKGITER